MIIGIMDFVCIIAAILPAVVLLMYVYKKDKVEKEPLGLLGSLLVQGCIAVVISLVLETVGERVLLNIFDPDTHWYWVAFAFLVVAAVEEGSKFVLLKRKTWNNPNFNFRFDGIVYAVFVSLGFAALENIGYVMGYGLSVAPTRALISVPGHMAFAVYMGYYYGRARWLANYGYQEEAKSSLRYSILSAIFYHGFFDACLMIGSTLTTTIFLIFVVITYVRAFLTVKNESKTDAPII